MLHPAVTFCLVTLLIPPHVCEDHLNSVRGTEGKNLNVTFTIQRNIDSRVSVYRNRTKISVSLSCSDPNLTESNICILHTSLNHTTLLFINLTQTHSGVYYLMTYVMNQQVPLKESNNVTLSVHPNNYTTTAVPSVSDDNSSSQTSPPGESLSSIFILVPVLVVFLLIIIVVFGSLYWSCRRKTVESVNVNSAAAQQVAPVVSCVEYCVLDFTNRPPGPDRVRNAEERVQYASVNFTMRKAKAQEDVSMKSTERDGERKESKERARRRGDERRKHRAGLNGAKDRNHGTCTDTNIRTST